MATVPTPPKKTETELGITFTETRSAAQNEMVAPKSQIVPSPEQLMQESHGSQKKGVFNVSEAFNAKHELGTIVTDKRNKKTSLADNLQSAFGQWWGGVKKTTHPLLENITEHKAPEARIPKAETRVQVIESAATNSVMAPKDDHEEVFEKVKTFRHDVEKVTGVPFTIKAPLTKEEQVPQWTHTVSDAKPPLPPLKKEPLVTGVRTPTDFRNSMVAPIVEKRITKDIKDFYKKTETKNETNVPRKTSLPNQIAYMHIPGMVERKPEPVPKKSAPVAPRIQPVTRVDSDVVPQANDSLKTENLGYVAKAHAETPVKPLREAPLPPPFVPDIPSLNAPSIPTTETFHEMPREKTGTVERAPRTQVPEGSRDVLRTALLWSALPGIAVIALLVFVFTSTSDTPDKNNETTRETVSLVVPHLFDVATETPIPLTSRSEFVNGLGALITSSGSGITQYYPTVEDAGNIRPATSEEFFTALGLGLPASVSRALDDAFVIGSVTTLGKNEPFIVLRAYNFDTLFAGMLAWEPSLRSDFTPLFDDSYVERDVFEDAVKNNSAVRILYDALGGEALVYAFVDKNTVVITSSVEALSIIVDEL